MTESHFLLWQKIPGLGVWEHHVITNDGGNMFESTEIDESIVCSSDSMKATKKGKLFLKLNKAS